jgi:23S rRNA (cytosine1962-C5)-methyltransferase
MKHSNILITKPAPDYELLDSGESEKLERFGKVILSRPDPQALWEKKLGTEEWKKADGNFTREENGGGTSSTVISRAKDKGQILNGSEKTGWNLKNSTATNSWPIEFGGLKFLIKPTAFKHVGLFPEQSVNWSWLEEQVLKAKKNINESTVGEESGFEVLNLFGYTGGATLACAKAGAKVVHVDGSKSAITWARENAALSGLEKKPVRWILDDARTFVTREIKRERFYDGIIMDPPAFGHGPDNELWKIEEHFLPLVNDCMKILKNEKNSDGTVSGPSFFIINGYSAGYSAVAYENILLPLVEKFGGSIEIGELAIEESRSSVDEKIGNVENPSASRLLPCGIFARWSKN